MEECTMKKVWLCFLCVPLAATVASAQTKEEQLAGWLKRFPQADTNKDGVLTEEEAKAFQSRIRARTQTEELLAPTHADVVYGSHPRNVLDLWLVPLNPPP